MPGFTLLSVTDVGRQNEVGEKARQSPTCSLSNEFCFEPDGFRRRTQETRVPTEL